MCWLKKHKIVLFTVVALLFSVVVWAAEELKMPDFAKVPKSKPQGAWVVYWNWQESFREAEHLKLDKVIVFGAHYDEAGKLILPSSIDWAQLEKSRKRQPERKVYLSFINDVQYSNGKTAQKDVKLLRQLFADEAAMNKQADAIVAMAASHGMDGVELDFENIWQESELVEKFVSFSEKVQERAGAAGLDLRIVLEPKSLAYADKFKLNAEYAVMFYNLYGYHSSAGPKANKRFINKTLGQMESLGGPKAVKVAAFAGGGFSWAASGKVTALTQVQAGKLAKAHKVKPERHRSGVEHFSFTDKNANQEVWYGDKKTFDYWASLAKEKGIVRFDLWCAGGNGW